MLLSYQIVPPLIVLLLIYRSYLQLLCICVVCLHYCNVVLYLDVSIFCVMTKYCSIANNMGFCLAFLFLHSTTVNVCHIILACNNLLLFCNIIMFVFTTHNPVMFLLLYYIVVGLAMLLVIIYYCSVTLYNFVSYTFQHCFCVLLYYMVLYHIVHCCYYILFYCRVPRGSETDLGTPRTLTRLPSVPRNTVYGGQRGSVLHANNLLFHACLSPHI